MRVYLFNMSKGAGHDWSPSPSYPTLKAAQRSREDRIKHGWLVDHVKAFRAFA